MQNSTCTILIFSLCVAFCCASSSFFQLDQKVFETLPKLPKSFSDQEWTRVQQAVQDAISCTEENSSWDQNYPFENSAGYPNCIDSQNTKRLASPKSAELSSCSKIPKILHQIWKNETVPEQWVEYHQGWRVMNPDWVVLLWTDQDQTEWIKANYDWFIQIYRYLPYDIERYDAFRYFLMWAYGGVYVDIDYECKKPLSEYVSNIRKPVALISPHDDDISNTMIVSVPRHELWGMAIDQIYQNPTSFYAVTKNMHILYTTGPKFLQNVITDSNYNSDICTLQKSLFHPCSSCDSSESCQANCEAGNCYASQHYENDWTNFPNNVFQLGKCNAPTTIIGVIELVVPSVLLMLGLCLKKKWHGRRRELRKRFEQHAC